MTTIYPIDIYLGSQPGYSLPGFMEKVKSDWSKQSTYSNPNALFYGLLSQYGRFWIAPDETLWYRNSQGVDQVVKQLLVTESNDHLISRLNGQTVPTAAVAQLRQLLPRTPKWKPLLDKLNQYRNYLERV